MVEVSLLEAGATLWDFGIDFIRMASELHSFYFLRVPPTDYDKFASAFAGLKASAALQARV